MTVTHHLEEIPSSTTHALLLADGRIVADGPIAETLTAAQTSRSCFEIEVEVARHGDRWAGPRIASAERSARHCTDRRSVDDLQVLRQGREVLVAVLGDDDEVLDPHPELAGQVDARARP